MLEDSSPIDIDRLECTAIFKQEELTQEERIHCIRLLHAKGRRRHEYYSLSYKDRRRLETEYESVATLFASFSDIARSDAEVVLEAVRISAQSFKFAHSKFSTNREFVCRAVKHDGMALEFAASELQGDRQLVVDAVHQDVKALQFVSEALCKDRDFLEETFVCNNLALSYIPFEVDHDWLMRMINRAIDDSSEVFESVDRSEALRKVHIDAMWLATAIDFQNDKEIVLAAVEQNPKALHFTSLLDDREVVLTAVHGDGMMLELADESLRRDREIVCAAIRSNPRARRFAIDKPLFDVLDTDLEDEADSASHSHKGRWKGKRSNSTIAGLTGAIGCCERRGGKQRSTSKVEHDHGSRQCQYSRKLR